MTDKTPKDRDKGPRSIQLGTDGELLSPPPDLAAIRRWRIRRTLRNMALIGLPTLCGSALCVTVVLAALGLLNIPGVPIPAVTPAASGTLQANLPCIRQLSDPKLAFTTYLFPWDHDNKTLLDQLGVYVTDAQGSATCLVANAEHPYQVTWRPTHEEITFDGQLKLKGPSDTYLINIDGTGIRPLFNTIKTCQDLPAWSPDGLSILFGSIRQGVTCAWGYLLRVEFDETKSQKFGPGGRPLWSPDGKHILFSSPADNSGLKVMAADGSALDPLGLPGNPYIWSPDGRSLAFVSVAADRKALLEVANLDGEERRVVTEVTAKLGPSFYLAWALDGQRLFFQIANSQSPTGAEGIYSVNLDGSNRHQLTDHGGFGLQLSSDGKYLAFSDAGSLWVMDTEGNNLHQLPGQAGLGVFFFTWAR